MKEALQTLGTNQKDAGPYKDKRGKGILYLLLWGIPLLLNTLGIIMITSVGTSFSIVRWNAPFVLAIKQIQWTIIAVLGMLTCYAIPLRLWKKYSGLLWSFALFLMYLTLLPGMQKVYGASRWINLGFFSIQPSEVLFVFSVIHVARKMHEKNITKRWAFLRLFFIFMLSVVPFIFQPDYGGAILLFVLMMGIYVEKFGWLYPLVIGGSMGVLGFMPLLVSSPYRMARVLAFLDPWQDPRGKGFQIIQGFIAFANGGLWGVGLGQGLQKLKYLPAAHTDFIFAAIGEELGFVGTSLVLLLFVLWFVTILWFYVNIQDAFVRTLLWGIAISVALPLIVNLGGVLKLFPMTGVPMPFISYGGSSLVMMWARVGFLLRGIRDGLSE
ncbi:putative peptidoglycan glycosyltransferase FtsW [Thermovirga sp.]|uniref:FtsW/RodA/SpoVE family cell cycle protein n=1 Tax=Thermovirga sp. TaxID=2699834 RepID=UPI0025D4C52E|nr:putative peptidoglycan glycosyltransferase FtsW [Thermovirga sp.]MBO8153101.1 cell division protein FtsW [Thermovirga sp.]